MRILVGKTFGIGNAVLSVPMVKSLMTIGQVDVLVGSGPDDLGAREVFETLFHTENTLWNGWNRVFLNAVPESEGVYDAAVMAIPFDGRWQNGTHYRAERVLDCRKRPGNVERLGFDMWEKHESLYQMENAYELGYAGDVPSSSFMSPRVQDPDLVYLGLGYKRDAGGFGLSKHFGNGRYAGLVDAVRRLRPGVKFVSTGGPTDMIQTAYQIHKARGFVDESFTFFPLGLKMSFEVIAQCSAYIGNDTGMMHVAASMGMPTCGLFAYPDLVTKNPPFCERSRSIVFGREFPSVEHVAEEFVRFVWG